MKRTTFFLLLALSVLFSACSKENEISKPVVSITELGAGNSKTAHIGGNLHLEADIRAEGKIANIRVLIHQEEEGETAALKSSSLLRNASGFKMDTTFTGVYKGVKNTEFHEHLPIAATALPGIYHLHFYVTDMEGNQTMIEDEVTFIYGQDEPDMD